jgi:hypothetical protein
MFQEFCFVNAIFDGNLLLRNSILPNKFTQTLKYNGVATCKTRRSMIDIDGNELVIPWGLVRGPPADGRNLCVPRVGVPESGDSTQPLSESNVGELS